MNSQRNCITATLADMTRKEKKSCIGTIEMLQRLAYNIHGVMDVIDADNCKKIIKAIEQEPCEDAVSRAGLLSMYECLNSEDRVMAGQVVIDIKALPSVTPTRKEWIPVSERLPKEYVDVICCTNAKEVFIASYFGKLDDGTECFDDNYGMMCEGDVVAWMPLPEPYKAESESKNEM